MESRRRARRTGDLAECRPERDRYPPHAARSREGRHFPGAQGGGGGPRALRRSAGDRGLPIARPIRGAPWRRDARRRAARCRRRRGRALVARHRTQELRRVGIRLARRRPAARHRAATAARDAPPVGRDRAVGHPAAARAPGARSLRAQPAALDRLPLAGFLRHARDARGGPRRCPRVGAPAGAQPASGADDQRPRRLLAAPLPAGPQGTLPPLPQARVAGEPAGVGVGAGLEAEQESQASPCWQAKAPAPQSGTDAFVCQPRVLVILTHLLTLPIARGRARASSVQPGSPGRRGAMLPANYRRQARRAPSIGKRCGAPDGRRYRQFARRRPAVTLRDRELPPESLLPWAAVAPALLPPGPTIKCAHAARLAAPGLP